MTEQELAAIEAEARNNLGTCRRDVLALVSEVRRLRAERWTGLGTMMKGDPYEHPAKNRAHESPTTKDDGDG